MKLKRHREDVRDLKLMQDAHVQAIAKRYQRLILTFEEFESDYFIPDTNRMNTVLKDAEE